MISIPICSEQTGNELKLQPLNPTWHWSHWRPWGCPIPVLGVPGGRSALTCLGIWTKSQTWLSISTRLLSCGHVVHTPHSKEGTKGGGRTKEVHIPALSIIRQTRTTEFWFTTVPCISLLWLQKTRSPPDAHLLHRVLDCDTLKSVEMFRPKV